MQLEIKTLFPANRPNLWVAQFIFTSPEEKMAGVAVAHNLSIKVRFEHDEQSSTATLLDTAFEKARAVIRETLVLIDGTSIAELRGQAEQEAARLDEPFQFTPFTPDSIT